LRQLLIALATALHLLATPARSQEAVAKPSAEVLAQDLREEVLRFQGTVNDMFGRQETKTVPDTVYHPQGDGLIPLVVFNHGRAVEAKRAQQGRYRPESMARYLVAKGFVVMVPNRIGYWETYGGFDPAFSGCRCIEPMSIAASDQVLATVVFARDLPYVDTSRWLVGGVSVGGLTSVATVGLAPEGLPGGINFSGGTGGNPDANPGKPCNPSATSQYWGSIAKNAKVPMVWLYCENHKFWGPNNPKLWHQAWQEGGGRAHYFGLEAVGEDGHSGINLDIDHWLPVVDQFVQTLGFCQRSGNPCKLYAVGGDVVWKT
jgi:dienelactone hydrolase